MAYIFRGRLCGFICAECPEPLSNVRVRLYRSRAAAQVTTLAAASPKETFAVLTEEMVREKEASLLAEAETDAEGAFTFELGVNEQYDGAPFEIDVYCATVPRLKVGPTPPQPRQFTITTLQPLWRRTENGFVWGWDYCLPIRYWCGVRGLFGAWVICGQVTDCESKAPLAGVTVRAFDADWLTDDPLGFAVTDGAGHFRIDYTAADFQVTFLSPLINVETPFPPFDSGPDVYFRIETSGGTALLEEDRSAGHKPGRENVGHCLCVDLCVDEPGNGHVDTIPLFTRVGQYRVNPVFGDFTADGLTTAGNYAFTGGIPLIGIMPDGQNSQALEYRFQVAEYDSAGVALGPVSDVVAGMIGATQIGELEYWDWDAVTSTWSVLSAPYYVNHPGAPPTVIHRQVGGDLTLTLNKPVKPGGWIEVPTENELFAGGMGRFIPNTGMLISLDTTTLTNENFDLTVPAPGVAAGTNVPLGAQSRAHRFKLFFQARRVIGPNPILSSNSLNKIVISNTHYTQNRHPNWAGGVTTLRAVVSLNIGELAGPGGGCNDLEDELHALYTIYHPFTGSASISFEGPIPPPLPAPLALAFAPLPAEIVSPEAVSPAGGHLFNITPQPSCAYILWLSVTLNLTSGYGLIGDATITDHIAFCKH